MMKKVQLFVAIAAIGVSTICFYACQKENEVITNPKSLKSVEGDVLKEYEYYTPNDAEIEEKLLMFTNCINHPNEYAMPDIELKEAIWLSETFFNIGICEKQKHFVDYSGSKKNFSIVVPFEDEESSGIWLKGEDFREIYCEILRNIVQDICPEFALDFGDVYISRIDYGARTVTMDIDVLYGNKTEKNFDELGRNIIIRPDQMAVYPVSKPNPTTFNLSDFGTYQNPSDPDIWIYKHYGIAVHHLRDIYMEYVLNRHTTTKTPTNIQHHKKTAEIDALAYLATNCIGSGVASGSCDCELLTIHKHGRYYTCPTNTTPPLTIYEYGSFGAKYRDYIYTNLCNDIPPGLSPMRAHTFFLWYCPVAMDDYTILMFQDFGLEYICEFTDTYTYMDAVPYIRYEDQCFTHYALFE